MSQILKYSVDIYIYIYILGGGWRVEGISELTQVTRPAH